MSNLGVKENMPIHQKKSIILFNQIARVMILLFLMAFIMSKFYFGLAVLPNFLIIVLPIIGFTLLLNYWGKVYLSVLILSTSLPLYFLFVSVYTKMLGINASLVFYSTPRMVILLVTLLPVALFGMSDIKKASIGTGVGILTYAMYDVVHQYFGIDYHNLPFIQSEYFYLVIEITVVFAFSLILMLFLSKVNLTYEQLVMNQRDDLLMRNEEITTQKEEIITQRDEIEAQRDMATEQRDKIQKQNKMITDSIEYASRIQGALMPSSEILNTFFPQNFIFFRPRDIVSGDFYWFKQVDNQSIVVCADCTGHGVPGAFMSMLGIAFLNEIVIQLVAENQSNNIRPNVILELLREKIKHSLHQSGKRDEQKDGMDIALAVIDNQKLTLRFAGAYNPAYILRKNAETEFIEIPADHQPIGIFLKEKEFAEQTFQLRRGDMIYLFSDGYVSQFGGERGDKFKTKRFKEMLSKMYLLPTDNQELELEKQFLTWKKHHEQIDDILVIGIKI